MYAFGCASALTYMLHYLWNAWRTVLCVYGNLLYIPTFSSSPFLRSQATSRVACVASWDTDGKIDTCDLTDEHDAVWTVWGWRARDVGTEEVGTWTGWSYACISSLQSNLYLGDIQPPQDHRDCSWEGASSRCAFLRGTPCWLCDCWR